MVKEDLISVIMSIYNGELKWIEESVESILMQTYSNFELVIILDNPDNILLKNRLEKYVADDKRVKLIINTENKGLVKSLNIALENCHGKYVARMDEDDISVADRLEKQRLYLEENDLDFIFSGVKIIDENGKDMFESNNEELNHHKVRRLLEITNCSYHPTWFLKLEIYKELVGYREIPCCEDYDFSLRCINRGYRVGKMSENILKYRIRSNSISRKFRLEQYLNMIGMLKLYKKNNIEDKVEVEKTIKKSKDMATKEESEKFMLADIEMMQSIELMKNKHFFVGIIKMLKSMKKSKFYMRKNYEYIKYIILKKVL